MGKKSRSKQNKPSHIQNISKKGLSFFASIVIAFIVLILGLTAYAMVDYIKTEHDAKRKVEQEHKNASDELMRKMKQMLDDEKLRLSALPPIPIVEPKVLETKGEEALLESNASEPVAKIEDKTLPVQEEPKHHELSEVHEYANSLKEEKSPHFKPSQVIRKTYPHGTTPKLAIIIDDVSFPWQARMMKEIPYKVTPAFFPPTKGHPETIRLSREFPFAMIHLPLEAKYFSRPEEDTLKTTDNYETIEKRIKRIKEWFPHISYYNNHTGGFFTAHHDAMDKLIRAMKAENLIFVDSRTIGNSKAPEITKKYDMFLYSRDVFLDNSLNKVEIRSQLQLAVSKAKKNGYAIAIGHPHKNTLEVLRDSKELLHGVDMVFVNEL